ncbi:MAG: glycosyltransferase family 4 protein, partial [Candidatus Micrarchaeaceae archaeon]
MRVLIFDVSSRLGAVGGAQRVAANLFKDLPKYGIDTYYIGYSTEYLNKNSHTFILKESKQKSMKATFEKANMHWLIESRPARIAYYSFYSARGINTSELGEWVKKVNPDIVVSNSIADFVVLRRIRDLLPKARLLYIEHANASGEYRSTFDYNILPLTFGTGVFVGLENARKRFFRFFDGVIALNKEQKSAVSRYNKNVTVIHSSSLLPAVKIINKRLNAMRDRISPKGNRIVLYLGRLAEAQKNVSTLIKAFKAIRDRRINLLIVGEGKSMPLYKNLASEDERIIFTGRVPEKDLGYYYSMSDLYVLPSKWESFNATFIEAATFGLPLLLSEKSINSDIKERFGGRLFTFNPEDAAELKKKLVEFFSDAKLRHRLIELSHEIAKEYSKDKQIQSYAETLKR